jgi:hypothetical protein
MIMRMKSVMLGLALSCSAAAALGAAIAGVKPVAQFVAFHDSKKDIDSAKTPEVPDFNLAGYLSTVELSIGIKAGQLDAWRDYTSALFALLAPEPPKTVHANPDDNDDKADQAKDPFDRESKLADHILKRAVAARRLKDAIAALRTALNADQLSQLAASSKDGPHIPRDAFDKIEDKPTPPKDESEH